jgi:hypothetical protein
MQMQAVVDVARKPINDASKARYSDADLLEYVNAFCRLAFEQRPDLVKLAVNGGDWTTPYADLTLSGSFPLPDRFKQAAADYASGRAETRDDENVNSQRAQTLMAAALAELK